MFDLYLKCPVKKWLFFVAQNVERSSRGGKKEVNKRWCFTKYLHKYWNWPKAEMPSTPPLFTLRISILLWVFIDWPAPKSDVIILFFSLSFFLYLCDINKPNNEYCAFNFSELFLNIFFCWYFWFIYQSFFFCCKYRLKEK